MTERADGQVTWSDLGLWSGKMYPEPSAATKGETSRQSSKRSSASQSRKPPILKCLKRAGQLGGATTMKWEDDGAWLGECMTRNTGESPNAAVVYRLSQILEATPQEKYSLSAKACQGLLRRAERRGKDLPKLLKEVLIQQSQGASPQERTEALAPTEAPTSYAVRIRGGCDGGGKGALVQTEKSGTLGTGNDQTIFCLQGNGIDRADTAGCSGNGLGIGKEGDPSPTLTAGDRHGVICLTPWEAQSQKVYDVNGVSQTLCAYQNSGMNREAVLCAGFKLGNSEQVRSIGYAEEQSPTLNAECGGNKPAVMCLNDQGGNVMGVSHDVSGTLRAQEHGHQPSILDMRHACDIIRDCGEIVPSLQARMGTGGNQVPLTYGIGNGQANEASIMAEEVSQALNTMHDAQAILYQPKSAMEENWAESETKNALRAGESKVSHVVVCEDVSHALRAKAACAYREDAETYPVQNMVVRRLTPLECERLQGYPDGWTDIGEWMDSKGKRHKDADSPRYKALGNSIALPFWDFLAKRISAQYLRPVTMGSLFDGIGGFPLVFERHNGKGSARWASEIEEFPIAVTKLRFGED